MVWGPRTGAVFENEDVKRGGYIRYELLGSCPYPRARLDEDMTVKLDVQILI